MPSSSLVEFEVEIGLEVEVGIEVEVGLGLRLGGVGVVVGLTCSHVYYFHGWVGGWVFGVEKSRIELTSAKLG